MSLQRKCFTASAVMHGLLLLLVFIGSAFIPHKPKVERVIQLETFDLPKDFEVTDGDELKVGDPNARKGTLTPQPPAPAPKQPEPQKQEPKPAEPIKEPDPVKTPEAKVEPVKPQAKVEPPKPKVQIDEDFTKLFTNPPKQEPKKKPAIDFKAIQSNAEKRTIKTQSDSKNDSKNNSRETQMAAAALDDVRKNLAGKLQSGSPNGVGDVDTLLGPGGGNVVGYKFYLAKEYEAAWIAPARSSARNGVVVTVVISRDGTVLSAKIVRSSGSPEYDAAADNVLRRKTKFDKKPPGNEPSVSYTFTIKPSDI